MARLNADGTLDETFDAGAGPAGGLVGAYGAARIVRQSDGKLIVSGLFKTFDGVSRNGVARLNPDGSLDTGYNPGRGVALSSTDDGNGNAVHRGGVNALVLQADGKLILYGFSPTSSPAREHTLAATASRGFTQMAPLIPLFPDMEGRYIAQSRGTTVKSTSSLTSGSIDSTQTETST